MQTVDREGFIAYLDGIFLKVENGHKLIVPELDCVAAEEALQKKEKVALTIEGKIVSYLESTKEGVFEREWDGLK